MSGSQRRKGYKGEYDWRKYCEGLGLRVVWHNEDPHKPDTTINDFTCEVKVGQQIPKKIYDFLKQDGADMVAMKKDREDWVILLTKEAFEQLIK